MLFHSVHPAFAEGAPHRFEFVNVNGSISICIGPDEERLARVKKLGSHCNYFVSLWDGVEGALFPLLVRACLCVCVSVCVCVVSFSLFVLLVNFSLSSEIKSSKEHNVVSKWQYTCFFFFLLFLTFPVPHLPEKQTMMAG